MLYDVLIYKDAPNPQGLPEGRVAVALRAAGRTVPYVEMDAVQIEQVQRDAQRSYEDWQATQEKGPEPGDMLDINSPDRSSWRLDVTDAGAVQPQKRS